MVVEVHDVALSERLAQQFFERQSFIGVGCRSLPTVVKRFPFVTRPSIGTAIDKGAPAVWAQCVPVRPKGACRGCILLVRFLDGHAKSSKSVMPDLIRHPDRPGISGFWLSPE
jgi:hypothetical protein